jgi:hypothetical protein
MMKAKAGRILMVEGEALHACDVYTNDVYACGGITNGRSWVGRSGHVHRLATLSFVKLLLRAQSLWQAHRSGRELGRVALPTVQRQPELSREGFPQYSLCPYGGIHWISLMNSTRQGNGTSSWTVRGKRGGPGTTVKRKKKKKKKKLIMEANVAT